MVMGVITVGAGRLLGTAMLTGLCYRGGGFRNEFMPFYTVGKVGEGHCWAD